MRVLFFATNCLLAVSQAAQMGAVVETPEGQLLAQTGQLSEMATEIEQTRKENNESDKKHMGLARYHLIAKIKKSLEQKTSASQALTGHIERIMKEKLAPKQKASTKPQPKTVVPPGKEKVKKPKAKSEKKIEPPKIVVPAPAPAPEPPQQSNDEVWKVMLEQKEKALQEANHKADMIEKEKDLEVQRRQELILKQRDHEKKLKLQLKHQLDKADHDRKKAEEQMKRTMQDEMLKDIDRITKETIMEKQQIPVALDTIDFYLGGDDEPNVVKMTEDVKFIPGTFVLDSAEAEKAQEIASLLDPQTFGPPPSVLRAQQQGQQGHIVSNQTTAIKDPATGQLIDPVSGAPVNASSVGKVFDPTTGQTYNAATGKPTELKDPVTGLPVDAVTGKPLAVKDPVTGQTVDPDTGKPVNIHPKTGQAIDAATGNPIVKDPKTGKTVDPATGKPATGKPATAVDPATGKPATAVDPATGKPATAAGPVQEVAVVKDPVTGKTVDPSTGKEVKKDPATGKIVDAATGKPIQKDPVTGKTVTSKAPKTVAIVADPITGKTVDPSTGKEVKKDPVTGKTVDAATGKPIMTDPVTGKTVEAPKDVAVVADPITGKTVDPTTGKEVKKDPVTGKTVDAATGKAIVTDPTTGKTVVDDDTENDVASTPVVTIDPVTGKTVDSTTGKPVIVDPVTGTVVDEATGSPIASPSSSIGSAGLATGSPQIVKGIIDDDDSDDDDNETSNAKESEAQNIEDAMKEAEKQIDEEAKKIEAQAKEIQSSTTSSSGTSSALVSAPIESAPTPMPAAIAALLKKPTAATTAIKAPVYSIGKDGKPVIKASALGALIGTNVAPTAGVPVTANMAMAPAVAAAINPSSTTKATVMRGSKSQPKTKPVTAAGTPAALSSPKASLANSETPDGKPDPVKKAISDVLRKKQQEKIQETKNSKTAPDEWSHPTVTKAVTGTDIQMRGCLYAPVKNNITQIVKTKPAPLIPAKPFKNLENQVISSFTETVPCNIKREKSKLIKEAEEAKKSKATWSAITKPSQADKVSKFHFNEEVHPDESEVAPTIAVKPMTKLSKEDRIKLAATRPDVSKPKAVGNSSVQMMTNPVKPSSLMQSSAQLLVKPDEGPSAAAMALSKAQIGASYMGRPEKPGHSSH